MEQLFFPKKILLDQESPKQDLQNKSTISHTFLGGGGAGYAICYGQVHLKSGRLNKDSTSQSYVNIHGDSKSGLSIAVLSTPLWSPFQGKHPMNLVYMLWETLQRT